VLGDWWDLGPQHFYSTSKPLTGFDSLNGMRIRHPGGSANAARISTLGASPILVPWPDVPLALSQNTVDGLVTTHESTNTAKLWDAGVRYCLEDFQHFSQYIPLVGETFWNKLSPADQAALAEAWQEGVPEEREQAAAAQKEARSVLIKNNVKVVTPPAAAITEIRKKLMAIQDKIVSDIGMDRDLVASVLREIRAAGVDV
jgi:C4-dicarboxylate-binding protein DctP